jgi:hypothetical protein
VASIELLFCEENNNNPLERLGMDGKITNDVDEPHIE